MSLKMSMFVFRLLQNEYSASITAQNPDLISGYNLCRREAQEKPTADVFYLLARGLCATALFLISAFAFAACQHSRSFLLYPLCDLIWHLSFSQPGLSFTHIYIFLTNAICRPLKICNITIRVFGMQPRQEPQSEEGIKLSEDFPSHTMFTFEQDSQ